MFSVATNTKYISKSSGEEKTLTFWHKVHIWGSEKIKEMNDNLVTGCKVRVLGAMNYSSFTPQGSDRKITIAFINPESVTVLRRPAALEQETQRQPAPKWPEPIKADPMTKKQAEDDLPF